MSNLDKLAKYIIYSMQHCHPEDGGSCVDQNQDKEFDNQGKAFSYIVDKLIAQIIMDNENQA